jgi:hypothetical protein
MRKERILPQNLICGKYVYLTMAVQIFDDRRGFWKAEVAISPDSVKESFIHHNLSPPVNMASKPTVLLTASILYFSSPAQAVFIMLFSKER